MKLADLDFTYPEELVATEPRRPSRVCWVEERTPSEITIDDLLSRIPAGDVLVLNDTKVLKRRVFAGDIEILFLHQRNDLEWDVLFPSRKFSLGDKIALPFGMDMTLVQKGRPQVIRLDLPLSEEDFLRHAELPLPPYIQKARGLNSRHARAGDDLWYQTAWAQRPGSLASPTASLHFTHEQMSQLKGRGVSVLHITLHVGLGTFLPVTTEDLNEHVMHEEYVEIPQSVWQQVLAKKRDGKKIWALGTTVARSLESASLGLISGTAPAGFTKLLIQPGYQWQIVDNLLTNFHQPRSTLLALVAAFSDLHSVKSIYQWAMERNFRLFSYGDLSVWVGKR